MSGLTIAVSVIAGWGERTGSVGESGTVQNRPANETAREMNVYPQRKYRPTWTYFLHSFVSERGRALRRRRTGLLVQEKRRPPRRPGLCPRCRRSKGSSCQAGSCRATSSQRDRHGQSRSTLLRCGLGCVGGRAAGSTERANGQARSSKKRTRTEGVSSGWAHAQTLGGIAVDIWFRNRMVKGLGENKRRTRTVLRESLEVYRPSTRQEGKLHLPNIR